MEARAVTVFSAVLGCGSWVASGVVNRLRPCCNLISEVLLASVEALILLSFHGRSGRVRGGTVHVGYCRSVPILRRFFAQEFVHVEPS